MIFGTVASSGAAHLKVTWDHLVRHHTEGSTRQALERKLGWGLQASSLQTGRLEGGLCPTISKVSKRKEIKESTQPTLHFKGRPLTLYPLS